jgi:hypothetical protein
VTSWTVKRKIDCAPSKDGQACTRVCKGAFYANAALVDVHAHASRHTVTWGMRPRPPPCGRCCAISGFQHSIHAPIQLYAPFSRSTTRLSTPQADPVRALLTLSFSHRAAGATQRAPTPAPPSASASKPPPTAAPGPRRPSRAGRRSEPPPRVAARRGWSGTCGRAGSGCWTGA